jgi:hypothetical protein
MKITKKKLRKIIRESLNNSPPLSKGDDVDTTELFLSLKPGDRVTFNDHDGPQIIVKVFDWGQVNYVPEGEGAAEVNKMMYTDCTRRRRCYFIGPGEVPSELPSKEANLGKGYFKHFQKDV